MSENILDINNLQVQFNTEEGLFNALNRVSFSVKKGETLGIVGESGCGKSVTSLSIMNLVPSPGKIVAGKIKYDNQDLLKLSNKDIRKIRGNDIAMIFQEPMTSLNPVYTVGDQIREVLELHQKLGRKDAMKKAVEMLHLVGIAEPEKRVREYPHQLSGGMRQRVMIAIALACNPKLLIADEPTTALDITIQAQILDLMKEMKNKTGMSIIFITHDLGVVSEIADTVMVMYAGEVVEKSTSEEIFRNTMHPYTKGLIRSVPDVNEEREYLETIPGNLPHFSEMPTGCQFSTRCTFAKELCRERKPELRDVGKGHLVRCWMYSSEWEKEGEMLNDSNKKTIAEG